MIYPLKFRPLFKERLWGGRRLAGAMDKHLPGGNIGESWELSGVPGEMSIVDGGTLDGSSLDDLVRQYGGELVGGKIYRRFGDRFPILVKLIDAQDTLSIQVHPDDGLARERHGSYGKTEMWYVVERDPGASLYVGFDRKVSRGEYLDAVRNNTLPSLLNRTEVEPGDAWFIPAGTIHAIGKGLLIAEIQQTSDITYRVYDWGRVDEGGNPRQLHTELAVDAIDFGEPGQLEITVKPECDRAVPMVNCPCFTTNVLKVCDKVHRDYSSLDSFVILVCVSGQAAVETDGGGVGIRRGETVLLPASYRGATLSGKAELLEVYM